MKKSYLHIILTILLLPYIVGFTPYPFTLVPQDGHGWYQRIENILPYGGLATDLYAPFSVADFTATDGQVLYSTRGVQSGSLTVVDTSTGTVKVVSGELELVGSNTINETAIQDTDGVTRALGIAAFFTFQTSDASLDTRLGFSYTGFAGGSESIVARIQSDVIQYRLNSGGSVDRGVVGTIVDATEYKLLFLAGGYDTNSIPFITGDTVADFLFGGRLFIKGGTFTAWTQLWVDAERNDATIYAHSNQRGTSTILHDNILIPTLPLNVDTMFQPLFLDTFNTGTGSLDVRNSSEVTTTGITVKNFHTFNVTDAPGKVTVGANRIILTGGDRDEDYYVTSDEGAGAITDFTHWVDVNVTAITDTAESTMYPWALTNTDDDLWDIDVANGNALYASLTRSTSIHYKVGISEIDAGADSSLDFSSNISVNTASYLAISRSGTTTTIEIYSSAALRIAGGSGDVDTIAGTTISTAFRYVYGLASRNVGLTVKDISGTISNLILDPTATSNELWKQRVGDADWRIDTNTAELGVAGTNPANNAATRYVYVDVGVSDFIFEANVRYDSGVSGANGLIFRGSAETGSGTNLWEYRLDDSGNERLLEWENGSVTERDSAVHGAVDQTVYKVTIIANGTTIRVYRDGALKLEYTSATFNQTATWMGLRVDSGRLTDKAFDNVAIFPITDSDWDAEISRATGNVY